MSKRKYIIGLAIAVVAIAGWYAFRPELVFVDATVNEDFPVSPGDKMSNQTLFRGSFHGVAHGATGTTTIYRLPDGRRVLRFMDFETSNGPDVRVFLAGAVDANDNETVTSRGYFSLGSIKGNKGDQNYELPNDLELDKYHSVVVWCNRFGVNFATAPLASRTTMN